MKKHRIIYWVTTVLIFLWQGVMPALTSHTEMAQEGIRHLGYPDYFNTMLTVFKVLGAIAIIIPAVPHRIKEWAYAGFTFDFIAASVSLFYVDGFVATSFFPLIVLVILVLSYVSYHKLRNIKKGVA